MADHQATARAILAKALAGNFDLRGREGQFLGGIAFDANPLSERQENWLGIIAHKSGVEVQHG